MTRIIEVPIKAESGTCRRVARQCKGPILLLRWPFVLASAFLLLVIATLAGTALAREDVPVPTPRPDPEAVTDASVPTPTPRPNYIPPSNADGYTSDPRFALSGAPMSLSDAIFLGLRQNRSIKSAYINRVAQKFALKVAEDRFTPQFGVAGSITRQRIGDVDSTSIDVSPGVSALAPTGAVFDFVWINSAFLGETERSFASIAELSVEQPLLRGAGVTVNTAPVRLARLGERNNQLQLNATVSETVASIIFAYRDLLLAQEELELAKQAVGRAEELVGINAALIAAGRMAAVEAVQAEADLENQKLRLLQAAQGLNNARFALLDMLGLDLNSRIVARERLTPKQVSPRADRLMAVALMNRPDYLGQLLVIEQSRLGYAVAENEQLWDIDLFARGRFGEEYSSAAPTREIADITAGLRFDIPINDLRRRQQLVDAGTDVRSAELQLAVIRSGIEMQILSTVSMAMLRKQTIGFVFQSFNLLARLTALDNAGLPLIYHGVPRRQRRERAARLLEHVGLGGHLGHTPAQLSGGQCQRVAIARALIARPSLLLADEPTGALDSVTASEILRLFCRINAELGVTVVIITHDPLVADHCRRRVAVRDGSILSDTRTEGAGS